MWPLVGCPCSLAICTPIQMQAVITRLKVLKYYVENNKGNEIGDRNMGMGDIDSWGGRVKNRCDHDIVVYIKLTNNQF